MNALDSKCFTIIVQAYSTLAAIAVDDVFRLEELNVIDVQFLHGCRTPTILLVHQVSCGSLLRNFFRFCSNISKVDCM